MRSKGSILLILFTAALGLRVWNAETATLHDDEAHYVGDAAWAYADLPAERALTFLRNHVRDHDRLDPDTGALEPWGRDGRAARLGHPPLFALVLGTVFALKPPATVEQAVETGRLLNALVDSCVVFLLPVFLARLGASFGAQVLGAGLYAVYPPAIVYGSLAYLDVFLAPLFVGLLGLLARPDIDRRGWIAAGLVTGLLAATKQTGLAALFFVPLVLAFTAHPVRAASAWGLTAALVVAAFVNPFAYVEGILNPLDPYARLRPNAIQTMAANLEFLWRPYDYYWLSYVRHGRPPAETFAPLNDVLTAPVLWLFVLSSMWMLGARRTRWAFWLCVPVLVVLLLLPPSDGAWRAHVLSPSFCAGAALLLTESSLPMRVAATAAAVAVAAYPSLPARASQVGVEDFLRASRGKDQPHTLHDSLKGAPPIVHAHTGLELSRRVWLPPGRYELGVESTTTLVATVDEEPVFTGMDAKMTLDVSGYLHELRLHFLGKGALQSIWMRRVQGD